MNLNRKQELFLKSLKLIKDSNVEFSSAYFHSNSNLNETHLKSEYEHLQSKMLSEKDIECVKRIQNELVEAVIENIMVLIDGYGDLDFTLDLIDRDSNESLRENIELHDAFMTYIENEESV
ncbi:MAG: hypothetical protein RR515_04580 [Clostridium sp.]